MFKLFDIHLAGPICSCDEQSISWSIWIANGTFNGLLLNCKECETQLSVPKSKMLARFIFDKAYPGKKDKESKLKCLDGGKVLELKQPDKEV